MKEIAFNTNTIIEGTSAKSDRAYSSASAALMARDETSMPKAAYCAASAAYCSVKYEIMELSIPSDVALMRSKEKYPLVTVR